MKRWMVLGGVLLSTLLATRSEALPAKEYRAQESTRCSYAQGCPRMLRNALSHASEFCREEGGPVKGGNRRDFHCEQRGIYCVVSGRIECKGRFDPGRVPSPTGMDLPVRRRRTKTCLEPKCSRFVSHAPGEQERGTHACPYGYLLAGVSGLGNNLVCQEFARPVRESQLETQARRKGMLACPSGMVARGVSEDRDKLLCARLDARVGTETVQDEKENLGLQVCGDSEIAVASPLFVTGIDLDRKKILCAPLTPR